MTIFSGLGAYGLQTTNALCDLINHKPDIDIDKVSIANEQREEVVLKYCEDPKAFIKCSSDMKKQYWVVQSGIQTKSIDSVCWYD